MSWARMRTRSDHLSEAAVNTFPGYAASPNAQICPRHVPAPERLRTQAHLASRASIAFGMPFSAPATIITAVRVRHPGAPYVMYICVREESEAACTTAAGEGIRG